ncbi:hypothetical protein A3A66_02425 [Microgenomates group bacterium RIFCSPLOWO2_01_FULL_46_13]|nr:MAG: hypothetical protein A3A66_02425 [Microgenomates group bacterium RIFCSPLOWO2_01_FULL_46_13]
MAETIERGCDGSQKWHWFNVMSDLEKQGGLAEVVIDPLSMNAHGCGGQTKEGTKFYITWVPDMFLLVSMSQEEQALVESFAKVVEFRPFCRYINEHGLLTVEWDKKDPEGRFAELQGNGEKELQRIQ